MIGSIRDDAPPALVAVKALASFLAAPPGPPGAAARAAAVARAEGLLPAAAEAGGGPGGLPAVQAVVATLALHEGRLEAALGAVRSGATLELLALSVQVMLHLDRPDAADRQLKLMQERDDESCLTALSAAAVGLALGGARGKEAALLYRDVLERYGETVPSLNGAAVAALAARNGPDADKALREALAKEPDAPDALANALAAAAAGGRFADAPGLIERLRKAAPHHPYVEGWARVEAAFDRVAATYAA